MLVATMARTSTRFKPMVKPMILPSAPASCSYALVCSWKHFAAEVKVVD
jgi:hypothetical protein